MFLFYFILRTIKVTLPLSYHKKKKKQKNKKKTHKTNNKQNQTTTEFKIPSPTARLLRFGDLTIRVPGAVFEFKSITDPAGAQTDINKRLSEFQKRQAENEARGRRNELSDWFAAYDQIRQPPAPRAAQPAAGGTATDGNS